MTLRWTFLDQATGDLYRVPINPNSMTDPESRGRKLQFGAPSPTSFLPGAPAMVRTFETRSDPVQWSWSGVINTQDHHDNLLAISKVEGKVLVTDHFGRTFEVMMKSFAPTERRPTITKPWRFTYEMQALVLRRLG